MTKQQQLLDTLLFACRLRRPHGGRGVEALARYIERMFHGRTKRDDCGNIHLDLRQRDASGQPIQRTLFVAHLDTVHRTDGPNKLDTTDPQWLRTYGDCLGADDGAGVAILCNMARSRVHAYYVFTQGEERGGVGAKYLADKLPELLAQFDRAIAFDRRDVWSVISHQAMGRCCSDDFANALADQLNGAGLLYAPDDTGVYTDTAEFTGIIAECTNVSVGYYGEHSGREELDLNHFVLLAKACRKLDWESLPTARKPGDNDLDPFMFLPIKGMGKSRKRKPKLKLKLTHAAQTWDYTEYDLQFLHAVELAMENRPGDLLTMLAKRSGVEESEREVARKILAQRPLKVELLESAIDAVENVGAAVAADLLLEELIGTFA